MLNRAVTFRDACPDDAARLSAIGRDTFVETFGALYPPSDLRLFLDQNYSEEKQLKEILHEDVDIRLASSGAKLLGYCKIGPVKLPIEHDPETLVEETVAGNVVIKAGLLIEISNQITNLLELSETQLDLLRDFKVINWTGSSITMPDVKIAIEMLRMQYKLLLKGG